jgi:aminomethyltransferase
MSATEKRGQDAGLKRTPLYEVHYQAGARFVDFAGWEMPVLFSGIIEEHLAVRSSVGLFDICHMSQIEVHGSSAGDLLQRLITNDLTRLADGGAQYTLLCYEDGGIVDDLMVYRMSSDRYLLCVNAANAEKDYKWMLKNSGGEAEVINATDDYGLIALQGPRAEAVLQPLVETELNELRRFHFTRSEISGVEALISRTGYTGEDGFELFVSIQDCRKLWSELLAAGEEFGIKSVGLGARDTLRLEMGYPLYGNEISAGTNPYQAGLGWVVKPDKGDFLGRDSLRNIKTVGPDRKLVGLQMVGKGIARQGHRLFNGEEAVGHITSGTMSPSLKVPIAMGYVPAPLADEGSVLEVEIRDRRVSARLVKRPFYRPADTGTKD